MPTAMTRDEFRDRLFKLGIGVIGFAYVIGIHPSTVIGWGADRRGRMQHFPTWVNLLLSAWEKDRDLLVDVWNESIDAESA